MSIVFTSVLTYHFEYYLDFYIKKNIDTIIIAVRRLTVVLVDISDNITRCYFVDEKRSRNKVKEIIKMDGVYVL
jgi:hypothetical protein